MSEMTNRDSDKFMLRLPKGMRDRVKVVANENRRSMNAEIGEAIERHLAMEEYRFSPEANQLSPETREIFLASIKDPSDLPATKSDIEKLYAIIKDLVDVDSR